MVPSPLGFCFSGTDDKYKRANGKYQRAGEWSAERVSRATSLH